MINNFRHACIAVKNLDKALKFYRNLLGLKVSKILTVKGAYPEKALGIKGIVLTYVKMRCPGQSKKSPPLFELHYWKNPKIAPNAGFNHISFTVRKIDSFYKKLSGLGVQFISEPVASSDGNTKICFCYDPEDNLIEFIEEIKGI